MQRCGYTEVVETTNAPRSSEIAVETVTRRFEEVIKLGLEVLKRIALHPPLEAGELRDTFKNSFNMMETLWKHCVLLGLAVSNTAPPVSSSKHLASAASEILELFRRIEKSSQDLLSATPDTSAAIQAKLMEQFKTSYDAHIASQIDYLTDSLVGLNARRMGN